MPILVSCEACRKRMKVADKLAGKKVKCPGCGEAVPVPDEDEEELVQAAAPAPSKREAPPEEEQESSPGEWTDHGGEPIPEDADFFVPPPPEIGEVLSAYTSLKKGQQPWPIWARILTTLFGTLLGAGIGFAIVFFAGIESIIWRAVWIGGLLLIGLAAGFMGSAFLHGCCYVGREGIALFRCDGGRDKVHVEQILVFRDAHELRTSLVKTYENGMYKHTEYDCTWTDVGGRTRFNIKAIHYSEDNNPGSTDDFQFVRAAEAAWTEYLLPDAQRQLETKGSIKFNLKKKDRWVRLGNGWITFNLGSEPVKLRKEDITGVEMKDGMIRFHTEDSYEDLITSRGIYKFAMSDVGNPQLFLVLVNELLGYQFD